MNALLSKLIPTPSRLPPQLTKQTLRNMSNQILYAYHSWSAAGFTDDRDGPDGMLEARNTSGPTVFYVSADKRAFVCPTSVWESEGHHDELNGWTDSEFIGCVFANSAIGSAWFGCMTEVEKQAQLDRFWDGDRRRMSKL